MNTDLRLTTKSESRPLLKRGGVQAALILLGAACVVGGMAAFLHTRRDDPYDGMSTFEVIRGPLTIDVVQSGTIQNRDLKKVFCEVEGRNSIIELVDEGTEVKEGDFLVKLDSSQLEERRDSQQIQVKNAEAAMVQAREKLAITISQAKSDNDTAKLSLKFAEMDLNKYVDGDYPQELDQAKADIQLAEESHRQAGEKWEYSKELEAAGYITRTELERDELEATRRELEVKLAKRKLELLETYGHVRKLEELQSDVEQAKAALDRTIRRGAADVLQAQVTLEAKVEELRRAKELYEKLKQQVDKCTITAPVGGMVVYATTGGGRGRRTEPLAKGQEVIQGQELIFLPVSTSMMAEAKVAESALRKVKRGLPAIVKVDAVPGKIYHGTVGKIGLYPDSTNWRNPDLKVYNTEIYIDGDAKDLRAGMNCEVQIIVEQHESVLQVPINTVVRVKGVPTAYVVGPHGTQPREVTIGLDNNRRLHILEGLVEGEKVLQAPPLGDTAAPVTEVPKVATDENGKPVMKTPEGPPSSGEAPAVDFSKLKDMSPEERRKAFESLTPEQREQRRKMMEGRRQGGGRRRPEDGAPQDQ